jgi:hypothetical protein
LYISGTADYSYFGNHVYYNGTAWVGDGSTGTLMQLYSGSVIWSKGTATLTPGFTSLLTLDAAGNLTATANVSAYSDERKKTNWRDLPPDFIQQLAKVKHGIYDRTDEEITQVGASAQSFQSVMPNAVLKDKDGFLSITYGNAALVACIQLAQKVVELEEKLAKLTGGT